MKVDSAEGRVRLATEIALAAVGRNILSPMVGKVARVFQTCSMGLDKGEPKTGFIRAIQKVRVYGSNSVFTSCLIAFEDGTFDNRILEDWCHVAPDGVYEWRA